ncbi:MAG: tRNA glutamyl-Q(34) synthetase GluQRS [Hyphomicrobiaceae bacterium]
MTAAPAVLRFAPSPTGRLHLGHALSALLNDDLARAVGGRLLLRIEDTDTGRCREAFVAGILDDLDWLGIAYEIPVRRQSEHLGDYRPIIDRLTREGLLYPCFATRSQIAAAVAAAAAPPERDPDGVPHYPGLWKDRTAEEVAACLAAGETPALRIDMARALGRLAAEARLPLTWQAFEPDLAAATPDGVLGAGIETITADPSRWGDAVIVRKDTPASYHLAVVVDDALQGVSHVVRGRDLLEATDLHCLIRALVGLPAPLYHHHRLLTAPDGRKLSKSLKDRSLAALRADGATVADIRRMVGL